MASGTQSGNTLEVIDPSTEQAFISIAVGNATLVTGGLGRPEGLDKGYYGYVRAVWWLQTIWQWPRIRGLGDSRLSGNQGSGRLEQLTTAVRTAHPKGIISYVGLGIRRPCRAG